jgi:hypothetical protein
VKTAPALRPTAGTQKKEIGMPGFMPETFLVPFARRRSKILM